MKTSIITRTVIGALAVAPVAAHAQLEPEPTPAPSVEDLDAAADAAAAAAEVTPEPTGDDIDLADLGLDTAMVEEEPALNIYGFADMNHFAWIQDHRAPVSNFIWKENSFFVGNLNLYLTKKLADRWRSMIELRFMYAPTGDEGADGTVETASAPDPADFGRSTTWGGISIERAYIEYQVRPELTILAGSFLTPYGIWNVDHGSPAIIGVFRPYVVGGDWFPERQTGIQLYGKKGVGDYTVGYHATISNGRGPATDFRDLDDSKALGGRLTLETPWLGGLRVGVSGYAGRAVDRPVDELGLGEGGMVENLTPTGVRYDELAYGADVRLERDALLVQGEILGREYHYLDGARDTMSGAYVPDARQLGGYVLAGYRFKRFWNVMPFVQFEHMQRAPRDGVYDLAQNLEEVSTGINLRPSASIVLKLNYTVAWFPGADEPIGNDTLDIVTSQVTWVF